MKKNWIITLSVATMLTVPSVQVFAVNINSSQAKQGGNSNVSGNVNVSNQLTKSKAKTAIADRKLTYSEAVTLVKANNSSFGQLSDSIELMRDSKKNLMQTSNTLRPNTVDDIWRTDEQTLAILGQVDSLESQIDTAKYQEEILNIGCEYTALGYFQSIKKAEMQRELQQQQMGVQQKEYEQALVKQSVGMASDVEVKKMQTDIDAAKYSMEVTELAIQKAYTSFNKALGLDPTDTYIIDYQVDTLDPLQLNADLESYISGKISSDPSIKLKDVAIRAAQFQLKAYVVDQGESSKSRETNLKNAQRTKTDAITNMSDAMRSIYNAVQQAETNHTKNLEALAQAEKDLQTAKINLEAGTTTKLVYDKAKLAVESAKVAIQTNIYDYEGLKFQMKYPSVASSAN